MLQFRSYKIQLVIASGEREAHSFATWCKKVATNLVLIMKIMWAAFMLLKFGCLNLNCYNAGVLVVAFGNT